MAQVDALKMVEHVRTRLVDLAVAENYMRDSKISDAARKVWEGSGAEGGLVSELWVEGAFAGERSTDSLQSLSSEGLFPGDLCRHLHERGVFPSDRLLYGHQAEAVRRSSGNASGGKPSLVITAGTGLGKTEAFLLPMLADLWTAPNRRQNAGIRGLILYPMNALVVDQVDRIYRWLRGQQRLTVFHFTSATPENSKRANQIGEAKWEPCRMRTRKEARGREDHDGNEISAKCAGPVPDIVITNYSMLEYMLCRPQDSPFFGPDLRCIILDEAHLYTGTLAAEIMMLLRRVRERCEVSAHQILQIATSATLGGNNEDLLCFASSLFSDDRRNTSIIRGRPVCSDLGHRESPPPQNHDLGKIGKYADAPVETFSGENELLRDSGQAVSNLSQMMTHLISEKANEDARAQYGCVPAKFLYACMREAPLARALVRILWEQRSNVLSIESLAGRLLGGRSVDKQNAAIAILRLGAAARLEPEDLPLIPHRLHFLVRAPEGLSVCLNPGCSGPESRKVSPIGCLQPITDRCRYCGNILLPVHRCDNCGDWALAAHENQETSSVEPGYYAETPSKRTFYLLAQPKGLELEEVVVDPQAGEIHGHGAEGVSLWRAPREKAESPSQRCPTCESSWAVPEEQEHQPERKRTCRALIGGGFFALSVAAETMLHDLPPLSDISRHWKPAQGRRLLAFSDSRALAARLGPLLTQQHETQVIRAAIARCVHGLLNSCTLADLYQEEIRDLEAKLASSGLAPDRKRYFEGELGRKRGALAQSKDGTPFVEFADRLGDESELAELLNRELEAAGEHRADSYAQQDWRQNKEEVRKRSQALLAKELQYPGKRKPSVESAGLIEIIYPGVAELKLPSVLEERLPENVRAMISPIWPDLMTLLLDTMRLEGCVDWTKQTDARKWMGESPLPARWMTKNTRGWNAGAFVGATGRQLRRVFARNVLQTAGCSEKHLDELPEQLLSGAFEQLYRLGKSSGQPFTWLCVEEHHQTGPEEAHRAIKILLDQLSVRSPARLFRCEATKTVWSSSGLGWAPIEGCRGTLRTVTPEELDKDPRWGRARREFRDSEILRIGLWAEEHSAQLSPEENRRLQDLFKSGIRNVLSSTTTMELGIDIGGLNGVLLGNVPPGPANHRQRAGRAGRRSDGSAVVVTYSRGSEYDRDVFHRFGDFLGRELRKPTIFWGRDRIIRRHLHAVLLSEFIRFRQPEKTGAMDAFGRMGKFCGISDLPLWRNTSARPELPGQTTDMASEFFRFLDRAVEMNDVRNHLNTLSSGTALEGECAPDKWPEFVRAAKSAFSAAFEEWKRDAIQLQQAWREIPERPSADQTSREMAKANAIRYMLRALCQMTVIEWFADRRFLPRYGFPINLQSLTIRKVAEDNNDKSEPDERYRLERSSLLALSEYVPESRILVGGHIARSRGLRKHWTDNNINEALGLQYFSLQCSEEHVYLSQDTKKPCLICGSKPIRSEHLVFPRFGYTTAGWDPPVLGVSPERIGEQTVCPVAFAEAGDEQLVLENFAGFEGARVRYREEALLLVRNSGRNRQGFAICTRCGFAMSETSRGDGRMGLPKLFEKHASVFSAKEDRPCWVRAEQGAPVLRNRVLAARELTDMLLLEWPSAASSGCNGVYSFGRALMLSAARLLELDQRELGMEVMPLNDPAMGIVIYDTAPGGAGHCQEIIELGKRWIDGSVQILKGDESHNARCTKACLDCILDFSVQHAASRLDRKAALELAEGALLRCS